LLERLEVNKVIAAQGEIIAPNSLFPLTYHGASPRGF